MRAPYVICAALIVVAGALGAKQRQLGPPERRFSGGVWHPVIAVELACAGRLPQPPSAADERARITATLGWDEGLLVAYAALFASAGVLLWRRRRRSFSVLVAVAGIAAAVCDHSENVAMRALLAGVVDACPAEWSYPKWALLSVALLGSVAMYVDADDSTASAILGLLAALAAGVAGLEGVVAVFRMSPALIEGTSARIMSALTAGCLYLATHHILRDGVGAWLDRVARWDIRGVAPFGALARWPPDSEPAPGVLAADNRSRRRTSSPA